MSASLLPLPLPLQFSPSPSSPPLFSLPEFPILQEEVYYDVTVNQSTIPRAGLGVFALELIPNNTILMTYGGESLTLKQLNTRYPGDILAPYAIQVKQCEDPSQSLFIDAARTPDMVSRYINTRTEFQQCNAIFEYSGDRVLIRTIVSIPKDDEIFVWYGEQYDIKRVDPVQESLSIDLGYGRRPQRSIKLKRKVGEVTNPSQTLTLSSKDSLPESITSALTTISFETLTGMGQFDRKIKRKIRKVDPPNHTPLNKIMSPL